MSTNGLGRRELKTRSRVSVQKIAQYISQLNITPNQISVFSVVFALIAAVCLLLLEDNYKWLLFIFFIQCRLFCNMLDGLVAIEGGKRSILGDIYNDMPDRIADVLILVAFGCAFSEPIINHLGWLAACLALMTAYTRTLFLSLGAPADYSGPLAKQHRMALVCLTSIIYWLVSNIYIIYLGLILLNFGIVVTIHKRTKNGCRYLLCN